MTRQNNLDELIIYTSTLYVDEKSKVRSELCLNMLRNAEALGVTVVLADGGSNSNFINEVKKLSNVVLIEGKTKSMGPDRRDALEEAVQLAAREKMQRPCFLWTEPEKDGLITEQNLTNMVAEIKRGSNIVAPARKENAWESLPRNQRWFEQRANKRSLELMKEFSDGRHQQLLDLWFGPKMFDREGAKFFQEYNKDNNRIDLWDAILVPVTEAIKAGKRVASVPVDYEYSENQRQEDSNELKKRLEQYSQILKEMGDRKWMEFFDEAKEALGKIKELKKKKESTAENEELLNEQKKSVLKSFFKIR